MNARLASVPFSVLTIAILGPMTATGGSIVNYNLATRQLILTTSVTSPNSPGLPVTDSSQFSYTFTLNISGLGQFAPVPTALYIPVQQRLSGGGDGSTGGAVCLDHVATQSTTSSTYGCLAAQYGSQIFQPQLTFLSPTEPQNFAWTFTVSAWVSAGFHVSYGSPPGYATFETATEVVDFGNLRLTDPWGKDVTSLVSVNVIPDHAFADSTSPEPGSLSLLLAGTCALVLYGRRRLQRLAETSRRRGASTTWNDSSDFFSRRRRHPAGALCFQFARAGSAGDPGRIAFRP